MSFVTSLFKKPKFQRNPLETGLSANPARKLVVGKVANGGDFVFKGLSDFERNDNRDLSVIMVLAGHECNRLTRVWVNGEIVHSELINGFRTQIDDYNDKGKSSRPRLWLTYHNGSPNQVADSFLASTPILPVNINSTAQLRGCAYVVATMRQDDDVLQSELQFRFEYEGASLYDRRKDSTAGGSGTHRLDDPSTWEYTDNPAVALDHYRLGIFGGLNNDQMIFGMGQAVWQNPYDEFEANADLCDEQVFGLSRYAFNGRVSSADDHSEVIQRFATQMAARGYYSGGRLYVRPKQTRPIKITLYDDDLVSDTEYELSVSPSGDDLVNTIKGSFSDPASSYNAVDYPDVKDDALISEDGRVFEDTLDLKDETNENRAQRIATIDLEIQKRRDQITETFMPIANVLEIGDWYERVSNLRGAVTKIYEVVDLEKGRGNGHRVKVTGQETDSAVTAFGENQAIPIIRPEPLPPLVISRPDPPTITAAALTSSSGGAAVPAIDLTLIPPAGEAFESVVNFEVQFGISNGLTGGDLAIAPGEEQFLRFANDGQLILPLRGLLPLAQYAFRVRSGTNRHTGVWGDFQAVTTLAELTATNTGNVGELTAEQVEARLDSVIDRGGAALEYTGTAAETITASTFTTRGGDIRASLEFKRVSTRTYTQANDPGFTFDQSIKGSVTLTLSRNTESAGFVHAKTLTLDGELKTYAVFEDGPGDDWIIGEKFTLAGKTIFTETPLSDESVIWRGEVSALTDLPASHTLEDQFADLDVFEN